MLGPPDNTLPVVPSTLATKPDKTKVFAVLSSAAEVGVLFVSDWVACTQRIIHVIVQLVSPPHLHRAPPTGQKALANAVTQESKVLLQFVIV